jgi:ABC-type dipeptide/oligopeptide/nickel transport system ATPase component
MEEGVTRQVFGTPHHAYTRTLLEAAPGRSFVFGADEVHT